MSITINDIIALSNAGFSKAEILALTAQQNVQPMAQQNVQPMAQQNVQPMAQQNVQPMAQQNVQPMAQQNVQPMAQQNIQPMAQQNVQPMVQQNVQPTVPVQTDNGVSMSNAQFTALLQSINAGNASIDLPPSYDINNVLADHYKTLMVGDSQKKGE